MIRMADVQRFAGQSRIDISIAIQEVVLTILLQRIYSSSLRDRLAFKGGTALRKTPVWQRGPLLGGSRLCGVER